MSIGNPTPQVEYRLVPDFPLYRAGTDGSLWSRFANRGPSSIIGDRWKRMKCRPDPDGRVSVILFKECKGKKHFRKLHQIILETFVGPCPPGMEACHDPDPDPSNNNLSNLRWATHAENMKDSMRHGRMLRGSAQPQAKLTEDDVKTIRSLKAQGTSTGEISRRFGVSRSNVSRIIRREKWKHVG